MRHWLVPTAFFLAAPCLHAVELRKETADEFDKYISNLESRLSPRWHGENFLWSDTSPQRDQLQKGNVVVQPAHGNGTVTLKNALIQDWMGAIFIPSANLASVLAVAQDYARHAEIYKPEVAAAILRSRTGNDFSVYMRIVKSKFFLTDVLNTEHEIHFVPLDGKRVYSKAYSTRIAEVNDPGSEKERELPVGKDRGLLWRLYGYWFYEERDGGVIVECESITLTRDVPFGMGHLLSPIVHGLPAESLRKGLESTRRAVLNHPQSQNPNP
ncbi:MAG TPA: hypothetical protein VKT81_27995 [Bryobacteraceae bacterium]|nr:hypothetical protein [Bryobacteraceae bacterium]